MNLIHNSLLVFSLDFSCLVESKSTYVLVKKKQLFINQKKGFYDISCRLKMSDNRHCPGVDVENTVILKSACL